MKDKDAFMLIFNELKDRYPHRNLEIKDTPYGEIVRIDNEDRLFNSSGYSLLFNIKRLCDALKNELY